MQVYATKSLKKELFIGLFKKHDPQLASKSHTVSLAKTRHGIALADLSTRLCFTNMTGGSN